MPLPKLRTPEWEREKEWFPTASAADRIKRAFELGYTDSHSYTDLMRRRGIRLVVPSSKREKFDKPKIIKEPCLIIFDSQIPFHDSNFIGNLLDLAMAWKIEQGISGGDFLNMTAFSAFFEKPEDKIWKKERAMAMDVIQSLQSAVPNWFLIMGNHENFLLRQLASQLDHDDILALIDRREGVTKGFESTNYYFCLVDFGGSRWRITHPRNVSVIHGRVPTRLCAKFHCNIASGHGHLASLNPDDSGQYLACDVGVTCDPKRLDYVSQRDTTRPEQCQGALFLMQGSDGKCYPYHILPNSDWQALKRMYK